MAASNKLRPVICISGPTATGKSNFAIELALKIGGEIINADSVQVYKNFDIGSGKVNPSQLERVKHHLISHVCESEQYSAGRFRREALNSIEDICQRGKIPMIVGGTGMYLRALFSKFISSYGDNKDNDYLTKIEIKMGSAEFKSWCYQVLKIVDQEAAKKIEPEDFFRVRRSLSLFFSSGIKSSEYRRIYVEPDSNLLGLVLILDEDTNKLYPKIDHRVVEMLEEGWIDEVEKINELNQDAPALKALGYRHIRDELSISNNLKLSDLTLLIKTIQRDTRRFAKRQRTWWNNQPSTLGWIPLKRLPKFNSEKIKIDFGVCARNLDPCLELSEVYKTEINSDSSELLNSETLLSSEVVLKLDKIENLRHPKKQTQLELQRIKNEEEKLFELPFAEGLDAAGAIVKEFLSSDFDNLFESFKCESNSGSNSERVFYGKIALI